MSIHIYLASLQNSHYNQIMCSMVYLCNFSSSYYNFST